MRKILLAFPFTLLCCLILPAPGTADSLSSTSSTGLTMTLDTSTLTVIEGNPIIATFIVTNNSGATVSLQFFGGAANIPDNGYVSGDRSGRPNDRIYQKRFLSCDASGQWRILYGSHHLPTEYSAGETEGGHRRI